MRTKRTETISFGSLSPNGEKEWDDHEVSEVQIFEDGVLRVVKKYYDDYRPSIYKFDEKGRQIYACLPQEGGISGGVEITTVYDEECGIATDTTVEILPNGFNNEAEVETREINNENELPLIYNEKNQLIEKTDEYQHHHYYTYDDAGRCIKIVENDFKYVQNIDNIPEDVEDFDSCVSYSKEEIPYKEITREYDSSGNLLSMEILVYGAGRADLRKRFLYFDEDLFSNKDNDPEDRTYMVRIGRKFDWKSSSIEYITPNFASDLENDWSGLESSACIFESIEAELLSADGTPTGEIELKTEMTVDKNCYEEFDSSTKSLLTDEIIRVHSNTVECDNGTKEHQVINRINSAGEIVEKLRVCDIDYNVYGIPVRKEILDYHNRKWEIKESEIVEALGED